MTGDRDAEVWRHWNPAVVEANAVVIDQFRANGGQVGGYFDGASLLLLHHVGATSGVERVTPLVYVTDRGDFVVAASKGGAATNPSWYHNLRAHPRASVEVSSRQVFVDVTETTGVERDRLYRRIVDVRPAFARYEQETTRVIPVLRLTPVAGR